MIKLLCINDYFPSNCDRPWMPIEGGIYTASIIKGRQVTLIEDELIERPGKSDSVGRIAFHNGRWPFRSNRFVDITTIAKSESHAAYAQEKIKSDV